MSIQAILSATDSGFSSVMKNAQQAVAGLGGASDQVTKQNGGFMSSVKSIASGIGVYKLASAGLGAISSGFGAVVGDMTESNIAWQTFDGNMQMLGQTPKQIGKVQKSLQDFATASIYGASDMATTYAQMAALGVDNTEQLVKGMGGLASSAENPQQAMKTLSQQMVQALAKPEMQWQDFKLMMESAPSAMAQVAKHMGMSLDDLIIGIQDGEIASKDFAQAVAEVGTNEQFSKLATTYKSTGQALDGMSETLANKLMPAFKALDKLGIKAVEGLSDMIDKVDIEGLVEGFSRVAKVVAPAFREIGKHISKVSGQVKQFFEPMTKGFGEIGKAVRAFGSDMLLAISYVGLGEWGKAWDTVKSSAIQAFDSITSSMGTMISGMWTNLKKLTSDLGKWFSEIDWGSVYDSIDGFFGGIQEKILAIDWKLVGGEIGGSVRDLIDGVTSWLDANVPKAIDYVQTVLFNPESQINIDAGKFHDSVMDAFNGFLEGMNIKVPAPVNILDWSYWDAEIQEMTANYQKRLAELRGLLENVDQINVKQEVVSDIIHLRGQGWEESDIEAWIDEEYDKGTYETTIELVPSLKIYDPEVSYAESIRAWADTNTEELTLEQQVAVLIDAHIKEGGTVGELQGIIDQKLGEGTYNATVNAELLINVLAGAGVDEATIRSFVDGQFGKGTYDATVKVAPKAQIVKDPMDARDGLASMVRTDIETKFAQAPTLTPEVKVAPRVTMAGGAGAEGEGGIDLSGITAQITSQLESLKSTVSSALEGIQSTITSQASSWGTSIASAMTTMVTSVTATMTAMTLAVTLGMTAMTLAVTMAMTSLAETITTTMTSMAETVTTTMTSMVETVTQAMTSMAEAITQAMTALVEAVTAGMDEAVAVAQSGAEGIVSAVSGLYDSMYSAGKSAGEGLADGLSSMEGAVRSAASALASAANIAAQATFLINSPSKVWRGFGYSAGEGLVDGFDGSQRSVKKSATRLAVAGLPSLKPFSGRSSHVSVSGNVSNTQQNEELKTELSQIKEAIKEGQVIMLDGNTWVGATVDRMDTALGNNQSLGGRHQLS